METLIPEAWFHGQGWPLLLVLTAISMVVLMKGADYLVKGASGFALRVGLPEVIVGATIVSLGTTCPEAAVSVMGAVQNKPGVALGNAVGSVIADTGLIFGVGCLMTVLPANRYVLNRQGWVQFFAGVALAVACYGAFILYGDEARLGRGLGILFLALLFLYLYVSIRWAREYAATASAAEETPAADVAPAGSVGAGTIGGFLRQFVVGLVLVVLSCRVLILAVSELAEQMGVPKVVVAATIIAFGTSLPELVVGITSVVKGHVDLLVGNVVGADILNVFFVIGASATASSLPIVEEGARLPRIFLYVHLPTMLGVLILFRLYIHSACRRGHFKRWYGLPLVVIWVGYVILNYVVSV